MKKILFFASALAGLFFAASCQQEEFAPVEESNVVTFEVGIPEVATKAEVVDNGNNINDLVYAVYRTDATSLEAVQADKSLLTLLYQKNYDADETTFVTVNGKQSAYVPVELLNNGQNFVVVFWAQVEDKWVGEDFNLLNGIGYPAGMDANNSDFAAFTGISFLKSNNLAAKKSIELKRPFAQINVASTLPAQIKDVVLSTSTVKVMKAGKKFDVINQVASETEPVVEFIAAELPDGTLTVAGNTYKYIAMNYVFASGNVEVEYTINTAAHGTIQNTVSNVPVAANYRTNIVGSLLTSTADYTVTLAPFDENSNSGTVEVITEGIVKNQNGDYEVSNENGLAYAINNLWVSGGNYYLTAVEYDMTGIDVTVPSIPSGVTLNIYGEAPVVTRSATSFAGITILGLDSLIDKIADGANVSISDVTIKNDDNSEVVLVKDVEEGAEVVLTDCEVGDSSKTSSDRKDLIGSGSDNVTNYVGGYEETEDGLFNDQQGNMIVKNTDALKFAAAVENAQIVVKAGDYTFPSAVAKGVTLDCEEGTCFKGSSNLNINGSKVIGADFWNNEDATNVRNSTINGIFEQCSFTGIYGIYQAYAGETCKFIECHFCAPQYSSNFSGGSVEFERCSFMGWSSFAGPVTFNECTFDSEPGGRYNIVRVYDETEFNDCEFIYGKIADEAVCLDAAKVGKTVSFTDCNVKNDTDENDSIFNHFANWNNGHIVTINGAQYKKNGKLFTDVEGNYLIFSVAALKDLSTYVNERGSYFSGNTFKLGANIDLNNEEWKPIGSATADHGFMGNFDGNGYTIKNLKIANIALDADGYAYAGLFGVTEGAPEAENYIKNLIIENVNISTEGHIVAAAIAYPYYTTVENVTVKGNISIKGGNYTSGALAYTRRCINAKNITVEGNEGSTIVGNQTVGGVISDIQMNGGLTANYSNFEASGLTIKAHSMVGGISGIISGQTLDGATVENVTLVSEVDDNRIGIVSGAGDSNPILENVSYNNVTGATRVIGGTYKGGYYFGQILEIEGVKAVVYSIENDVKAVSVEQGGEMTWDEAMEWAQNLGTGWNLSSLEELKAIYNVRVELNKALAANDTTNALFEEDNKEEDNTYAAYWSSTLVEGNSTTQKAYYFYFDKTGRETTSFTMFPVEYSRAVYTIK